MAKTSPRQTPHVCRDQNVVATDAKRSPSRPTTRDLVRTTAAPREVLGRTIPRRGAQARRRADSSSTGTPFGPRRSPGRRSCCPPRRRGRTRTTARASSCCAAAFSARARPQTTCSPAMTSPDASQAAAAAKTKCEDAKRLPFLRFRDANATRMLPADAGNETKKNKDRTDEYFCFFYHLSLFILTSLTICPLFLSFRRALSKIEATQAQYCASDGKSRARHGDERRWSRSLAAHGTAAALCNLFLFDATATRPSFPLLDRWSAKHNNLLLVTQNAH